jgi:hypothetical protein
VFEDQLLPSNNSGFSAGASCRPAPCAAKQSLVFSPEL